MEFSPGPECSQWHYRTLGPIWCRRDGAAEPLRIALKTVCWSLLAVLCVLFANGLCIKHSSRCIRSLLRKSLHEVKNSSPSSPCLSPLPGVSELFNPSVRQSTCPFVRIVHHTRTFYLFRYVRYHLTGKTYFFGPGVPIGESPPS